MRIEPALSDAALIRELGKRIEAIRLQKNVTRKEVAELAGVSQISIRRLELGEVATRLSTFVAICRALGLTERFEVLLPAASAQPLELLQLRGKQRQRARKSKKQESGPWEWGESS